MSEQVRNTETEQGVDVYSMAENMFTKTLEGMKDKVSSEDLAVIKAKGERMLSSIDKNRSE